MNIWKDKKKQKHDTHSVEFYKARSICVALIHKCTYT